MYSFLSEFNLINHHQSGFRHFHSTETSLINMVDGWLSNVNSGKMTGVAFVDLRKYSIQLIIKIVEKVI